MKTDIDLNKTAVINYLCSNYEKFNWERDNQSFDINMSVGKYTYRLISTRSDERYLQVTPKGETCGVTVSAKDYKNVDELYELVRDYVNAVKQDKQWNNILTDLMNN